MTFDLDIWNRPGSKVNMPIGRRHSSSFSTAVSSIYQTSVDIYEIFEKQIRCRQFDLENERESQEGDQQMHNKKMFDLQNEGQGHGVQISQ